MKDPTVVLLDVYQTVLTCDFDRHLRGLADSAGADPSRWATELAEFVPALDRGQMSISDAFTRVLTACGVAADPITSENLVLRDAQLLVECSKVFPDVLPSIARWRALGIKVALVSNCVANTRTLLDVVGLSDAVDAIVLSCEVEAAKPSPVIYKRALDSVGSRAGGAVFVDDQERYCQGAEDLGIQAVLIDRAGTSSHSSRVRPTVDSLAALLRSWAADRPIGS